MNKILIISIYDGFNGFSIKEIIDGKVTELDEDENITKILAHLKFNHIYDINLEETRKLYPGYDLYILCQDGDCDVYIE